jgi:hypothetical protein
MKGGFVAISTVLVLMAVMMSAVVAITYLSIGELQAGLVQIRGEESLGLVEGCVEDLLVNIRKNPNFSAASLTRPEGVCTFIYNSPGPNWDVTVSGNNSLSPRKIRVWFTRGNTIGVAKWQEE